MSRVAEHMTLGARLPVVALAHGVPSPEWSAILERLQASWDALTPEEQAEADLAFAKAHKFAPESLDPDFPVVMLEDVWTEEEAG